MLYNMKVFVNKFEVFPIMDGYEGNLPGSFWAKWTNSSYGSLMPWKSWVCPVKLVALVKELEFHDKGVHCSTNQLMKALLGWSYESGNDE